MEQKKILAKAYANENFESCSYHYAEDKRLTDYDKIKEAFVAGFNSGKKLKWNKVNKKLPTSDHECLCWVENKNMPLWSSFEIGSYQNSNWYLQEGRGLHEIVTHWTKIKKPK